MSTTKQGGSSAFNLITSSIDGDAGGQGAQVGQILDEVLHAFWTDKGKLEDCGKYNVIVTYHNVEDLDEMLREPLLDEKRIVGRSSLVKVHTKADLQSLMHRPCVKKVMFNRNLGDIGANK